jgi:hypothetical protein
MLPKSSIPHHFVFEANVGIVQPVEVVIARQRDDKHVFAESDTDATTKEAVFSVRQFV